MDLKTSGDSSQRYIFKLSEKRLPNSIGNKAANLRYLWEKNFLIPDTQVCSWQAYMDYIKQGNSVLASIRDELGRCIKPKLLYAIRSSANFEDDLQHSFAGQFRTVLEVQGLDSVLSAILEIWENTRSESVLSYLEMTDDSRQELKMAVIIQEMIHPVVSGVAFSKNPISALDEVLVEAVTGKGTSLVQEGHTPMRWVNKWGEWIQIPTTDQVSLDLIRNVVDGTKRIARISKREVDLEWVFDGNKLYWLQLRDITSINQSSIYSNKIAREMSPGMIKPLVWSVSIPVPARTWVKLIEEITGDQGLNPTELVRSFHYRVYYNMGLFGDVLESLGLPRESLELMMGILPPGTRRPSMKISRRALRLAPRLFSFLRDKLTFAEKFEEIFPILFSDTYKIPIHPESELTTKELISTIEKIIKLNQDISYYTVVTILLFQAYTALLRSRLKKQGVDFQQLDLVGPLPELERYDPGNKLKILNQHYLMLDEHSQSVIKSGDYSKYSKLPGIDNFKLQVNEFFDLFGHLSDSTSNFTSVPWRETPGLILQLIADYQMLDESERRLGLHNLRRKNWVIKILYHRARKFRLYREMISSLYTYSLMLARSYYLAIADGMVTNQDLKERDDIFLLYDPEIRLYVNGDFHDGELKEFVTARKIDMERCQDAILPEVIFGDEVPLIVNTINNKLTGTPTSKGYYTGSVRVVNGIQDFYKLSRGDVLVIPYSDVGWTPLFAKAGGVIAESGGILSHSSIIAREYNIPAVVSVFGALQLIDGTLVTIDGYKGEILIHDQDRDLIHSDDYQILDDKLDR